MWATPPSTGFDFEFKALLSDNIEVGFNMTSINDAFVNAPAAYEESRAIGGSILKLDWIPNQPCRSLQIGRTPCMQISADSVC